MQELDWRMSGVAAAMIDGDERKRGGEMTNRSRYQDKRDFVIHWLLEFQWSTPRILSQALGLKRTNQSRFFQLIQRGGLVQTIKSPFIYEHLYYLGKEGKALAQCLSEKAELYAVSKTSVVSGLNIHHLSVQQAVLTRSTLTLPFDFQSEWHLDLPAASRPDAIVATGHTMTALEVELAQKTAPRIYLGFLTHLNHFKQQYYDRVEYIFSDAALRDRYYSRFSQPQWPMFTRTTKGQIVPLLDGQGKPMQAEAEDPLIRERFTFTHEALYR
jgi:hypothetical protein